MKVAGLDICKGYAVAWILEEFPADPRKFYKAESKARSRTPDKDLYTFRFCHDVYEKVNEISPAPRGGVSWLKKTQLITLMDL